jgi:ParB family transcriptional regulator, chromosome partitioning protein
MGARQAAGSPKGAAIFVANCLARDPRMISDYHGGNLVAELLGVAETQAVKKLAADLGASDDGRAQVITLAVVAALDARTPKDAWRGSLGAWQYYVTSGEYLKFLAAQGYPLAPIGEVIIGDRTDDDVSANTVALRHEDGDDVAA